MAIENRISDPDIQGAYYYKKNGQWHMWDPRQKMSILLAIGKDKAGKRYLVNRKTRLSLMGADKSEVMIKILNSKKRGTSTVAEDNVVVPDTKKEATTEVKEDKDTTAVAVVVKNEEPSIAIEFKDKSKGELRGDGKVWYISKLLGAEVRVPMKQDDILLRLTGNTEGLKLDAEFLKMPDDKWGLPVEVMREWAVRLLEFTTEALCIYGKRRDGLAITEEDPMWLAVVPKQEVSGASVDVDDFTESIQVLAQRGYRRLGTIHTHPGGGIPCCSKTDKDELWKGFGGIHYIISRDGGVATYLATADTVWDIAVDKTDWNYGYIWNKKEAEVFIERGHVINGPEGDKSIISQSGTTGMEDIRKLVTQKKWINNWNNWDGKTTSGTGYKGTPWWDKYDKAWRIWDSEVGGTRLAGRGEVAEAGLDWDNPPGEKKEDVNRRIGLVDGGKTYRKLTTSDSIAETLEIMETWPNMDKREMKALGVETKMLIGSYERYIKVINKYRKQWMEDMGEEWCGNIGLNQIIYNLTWIEDALYGIKSK